MCPESNRKTTQAAVPPSSLFSCPIFPTGFTILQPDNTLSENDGADEMLKNSVIFMR